MPVECRGWCERFERLGRSQPHTCRQFSQISSCQVGSWRSRQLVSRHPAYSMYPVDGLQSVPQHINSFPTLVWLSHLPRRCSQEELSQSKVKRESESLRKHTGALCRKFGLHKAKQDCSPMHICVRMLDEVARLRDVLTATLSLFFLIESRA